MSKFQKASKLFFEHSAEAHPTPATDALENRQSLFQKRPYNPEAKGKQERYNQTADSFLREASLVKPKTVDELNRLYQVWMEDTESLQVRLNVMENYKIAGIAEWKLGFETSDVWEIINTYLNQ